MTEGRSLKDKGFYTVVLLVVFIVFWADCELSAKVSSKIEGRVTDASTGEPLLDVTVKLWAYLGSNGVKTTAVGKTKTDFRGYFVFNGLQAGKWILSFSKKSYISPLREVYEGLYFEGKDILSLNAGEIRFVAVKMEKGRWISGSLLMRDASGLHPFNINDSIWDPRVSIYKIVLPEKGEPENLEKVEQLDEKIPDQDGNFLFCLAHLKNYRVLFKCFGFADHIYDFEAINNQPDSISHIFDKTTPTKIIVKVLLKNYPVEADVTLLNAKGDIVGFFVPEKDGLILYDVPPAFYKLDIYVSELRGDAAYKYILIEVVAGISQSLEVKY